ncbi:hypothetical protein SNEBB_007866, partial [Seison nebaliae]
MDSEARLLKGRPFGGMAVLYRRNLAEYVSKYKIHSTRVATFVLGVDGRNILMGNVYMPWCSYNHMEEFIESLGLIESIIEEQEYNRVCFAGDFNSTKGTLFGEELWRFCASNELEITDDTKLPVTTFTYVSDSHNTVSWPDHIITSENVHQSIKHVEVILDILGSDHLPLSWSMELRDIPALRVKGVVSNKQKKALKWNKLNNIEKRYEYMRMTGVALQNVVIPVSSLQCKQLICKHDHKKDINQFYNDIVGTLKRVGKQCLGQREASTSHNQIAGWNEYVASAYEDARQWYKRWLQAGRPRHGDLAAHYRISKAQFKYTLRNVRNNEKLIKVNQLAQHLLNHEPRQFWKVIKTHTKSSHTLPDNIDSNVGENNIAKFWRGHYEDLLNSVANQSNKFRVENYLTTGIRSDKQWVDVTMVSEAVEKCPLGKAIGTDGVPIEAIRYAHERLTVLLTLLFNSIICKGVLPSSMLDVTLIPLLWQLFYPKCLRGALLTCVKINYNLVTINLDLRKTTQQTCAS